MVFFIIPAVIIPCLVLGCVIFFLCAAVPITRRFALSAALWCVALSPWILFLIFGLILCAVFFGLAREAVGDSLMHLAPPRMPGWSPAASRVLGYLLAATGIIGCLVTATIAAVVHQIAIHRLTLALFRLYVAAVSFGVAILSSLFALIALGARESSVKYPLLIALPVALLASLTLATLCYRSASQFRGDYPTRFPIVTPDEFGPTEVPH